MKNSKSVKRILSAAFIGAGLLLSGQKIKAEGLDFYGGLGVDIKTFSAPTLTKELPDYLKDSQGASLNDFFGETTLEARLGAKYNVNEWMNLKAGVKGNLTASDPSSSYAIASSYKSGLFNLGGFAKATFFDFLFAGYSVDFMKEYFLLKGQDSYKLADFINHEISAGVNIPFSMGSAYDDWTTQAINSFPFHKETPAKRIDFIRVGVGIAFPQIISTTDLGKEVGIKTKPSFTFNFQLGIEN
jgi:hypothetical protein